MPVDRELEFRANSPATNEEARGLLLATDDFFRVIVTDIFQSSAGRCKWFYPWWRVSVMRNTQH